MNTHRSRRESLWLIVPGLLLLVGFFACLGGMTFAMLAVMPGGSAAGLSWARRNTTVGATVMFAGIGTMVVGLAIFFARALYALFTRKISAPADHERT